MKKLHKIKYIALGLIIGLLISITPMIVFASSDTRNISALYNDIKIVVDGRQIHPRDANGNAVEPFIYNGTTYLPVRAIADALGKAVSWDGPNYTVYLGNMDGKLEYPTLRLKDAQNISGYSLRLSSNEKDNYGNTYVDILRSNWGRSNIFAEYLLDMKYSKFRGTFFIPDGETSDTTWSFEVRADGNVIYSSPPLDKGSRPVHFDINVTGYNRLQITNTSGVSSFIYIADAGLYQ